MWRSRLLGWWGEVLPHTPISHPPSLPARTRPYLYQINSVENENVVAQALKTRPDWRLRHVLPEWPRRGKPAYGLGEDDAQATVRFCPVLDLCLGFFIACFEPSPKDNESIRSSKSTGRRKRKLSTVIKGSLDKASGERRKSKSKHREGGSEKRIQ